MQIKAVLSMGAVASSGRALPVNVCISDYRVERFGVVLGDSVWDVQDRP